jgi:hypothetical protein
VRPRAWLAVALALALAGAIAFVLAAPTPRANSRVAAKAARANAPHSPLPSASADGVLRDPIDPRFLTELPFGKSSFWIQPWRAYLDTWPSARLLDAVGINFDVKASMAESVARLLHDSGFKLARIAINWAALSYANPSRFVKEADLDTRLHALRDNRLRPLILLDANSVGPAPAKRVILQTVAPAPAGSTQVQLSQASAAGVVPGKTGFDSIVFNPSRAGRKRRGAHRGPHVKLTPEQKRQRRQERRAAGITSLVLQGNPAILIVSVSAGGTATLSRPLPAELPAGAYKGTTLLYAPFAAPKLASGAPNPAFRETLAGWLSYVGTVCRKAATVFGPSGYDLEVWNEPTFGSQFLDASRYSSSGGEGRGQKLGKQVSKALLDETVAYVRDPAHGISPAVGVSDGFADQTPFASANQAPRGLSALSKHLYNNAKSFPSEFKVTRGNIPLDARGARDTVGGHGSSGALTPLFVPHFQSFFPEYFLTALQTATVVRDLAPIETTIYGAPYGRAVSPPHGKPLAVWMTEYNLNPGKGTVVGPDGVTPQTGASATLTPADKAHFRAKALLRSLVAMVGKGMTREYFFDASPGPLSLIGEEFNNALAAHPGAYPGDQTGGETMSAFRNLLSQFQGPGPEGPARQLKLTTIAQDGNHAQFQGDGTPAHPSLYDREALAVLPFQASPTKFVIPIYVMTRNLLTLYKPSAPTNDTTRFDLPNETFRVTLANLPQTTNPPTLSAYDPLRGGDTPARLLAHSGDTVEIELAASDYPRVLTLAYPGK